MGATGWRYFVDWQKDINEALKALQKEVFRTRKYQCQHGGDPHEWIEGLDELFVRAGQRRPQSPPIRPPGWSPATIDELLAHVDQEGTHSILDVLGVAITEEFGHVYPAPEAWLLETYGTTRPTRQMVEADEIPAEIRRGRFRRERFPHILP